MPLLLDSLYDTRLDDRTKGIPGGVFDLPLRDVGRQGWNVLRQDLPLPLMVLKESALRNNAAVFRDWTTDHGVSLAPHGKTTMAPQLFERQLLAGAWGLTAATVTQVQVMRHFGVGRIMLANQLIGRPHVKSIVVALNADPAFDFYCLVDSPDQVRQVAAHCREFGLRGRLQVLLEIGAVGGRTGCRNLDEARATLTAIRAAADVMAIAGIEGYEGVLHDVPAIDAYLAFVGALAAELTVADLAGRDEMLLTAGGSAFFDRVAAVFRTIPTPIPARIVIRSGCYLTHDSGVYDKYLGLARERGVRTPLLPALEVWAYVQSRPESALAILSMGKRDVPHDAGLPIPTRHFRPGVGFLPPPVGEVYATNDQHGYLRGPVLDHLQVGDMLAFGISHPCTAFDKWRFLPLVNDDYDVIDGILTYF